jgi:ferredoxin
VAVRVLVEHDVCISSGKCVGDLPRAFAFDEDEIAVVVSGAAEVPDDRLIEQARRCPSGAIVVTREDGSEVDLL